MLGCGTALDELSVVDISEGINEGCVVLDMITGSPELVVLLEGRDVLTLGACLETTIRTVDNDNDKANKYFKDPSEKVKAKQAQMLSSQEEDNEGNALIQKLRKQSEDNKEKNDLIVRQKTLLNDQVRGVVLYMLCS